MSALSSIVHMRPIRFFAFRDAQLKIFRGLRFWKRTVEINYGERRLRRANTTLRNDFIAFHHHLVPNAILAVPPGPSTAASARTEVGRRVQIALKLALSSAALANL